MDGASRPAIATVVGRRRKAVAQRRASNGSLVYRKDGQRAAGGCASGVARQRSGLRQVSG